MLRPSSPHLTYIRPACSGLISQGRWMVGHTHLIGRHPDWYGRTQPSFSVMVDGRLLLLYGWCLMMLKRAAAGEMQVGRTSFGALAAQTCSVHTALPVSRRSVRPAGCLVRGSWAASQSVMEG